MSGRRCSAEFALAVLELRDHGELAALVRSGRLTAPKVGAEDFSMDEVGALARALDEERGNA